MISDLKNSLRPDRRWGKTAGNVVVDQPYRLHHGVRGGRPEEAEAKRLKLPRQRD